MDRIEDYQLAALRLGRMRFAAEHSGYYLVKRPTDDPPTSREDAPDQMQYETVSVVGDPETDPLEDGTELDWEWRVAAIKKREGNPFPDRISVGRARNCDVVLRLPYVSKLHAHFHIDDGALALRDQRSANGTSVNGRDLAPGEKVRVRVGDLVSFGSIELEVVDGGKLYDVLMTEARKR